MAADEQGSGLLFGGLIAGALIGAGVGLAITPRTGAGNRRALELKVRQVGRGVRHSVIEATTSVQQLVGAKMNQAQQAVSAAASSVKVGAADVAHSVRSVAEAGVENVRQAGGIVADTVRQKVDDVRQASGDAADSVRQKVGAMGEAETAVAAAGDQLDEPIVIPTPISSDQQYSA